MQGDRGGGSNQEGTSFWWLCGSGDVRGGLIIYSHVGNFLLPGVVWAITKDPGDWQRDQQRWKLLAGWLLVLWLSWPGLWFLQLWENSCEGSGPCGTQAGCGAGGREWQPGHLLERGWGLGAGSCSSGQQGLRALCSLLDGAGAGLYRQWRKRDKSILAYHTPYGMQTGRAGARGWVCFV